MIVERPPWYSGLANDFDSGQVYSIVTARYWSIMWSRFTGACFRLLMRLRLWDCRAGDYYVNGWWTRPSRHRLSLLDRFTEECSTTACRNTHLALMANWRLAGSPLRFGKPDIYADRP